MNMIEMRRKHVAFSISQNPAQIHVHMEEKVDAGGYFQTIESEFGLIARIYQSDTPRVQLETKEIGQKQSATHYGLLADYQANLQSDKNVLYKFDWKGMHFQIRSVTPQLMMGEVVGYQCELERVS
ncbi:hypothetical protein [Bacillus sp. FJAT-45350]|uniref:hypothetical protein n=1 Tax=Bacillus sp. FJAT-45350 TaxID=2011014 RepID=UPI000BB8999A|nr:hypothetical protein [Bacillus sp. FJAT-45350]